MLVLKRRLGEAIIIGEGVEIEVRVVSIEGNTVRLAIEAPRDMPVNREEVARKKGHDGNQRGGS